MQQEIRFATFNAYNLAAPGMKLYDNLEPLTQPQYEAKVEWTAQQLDVLDADVIGFQEIFSQAALRDVLSRTRSYRNAHHAGFDPDPALERLTPSLALVSRLPLAGPALAHAAFPEGVALSPAPGLRDADRFARPPLHARIVLSGQCEIDVLVVHLKSKLPDYHDGDASALRYPLASLRSLIRRGTEAVALRVLLTQLEHSHDKPDGRPHIVLGDFNDVLDAVTTTIVLGTGAPCEPGAELADRLFDSRQIQTRQDALCDPGHTYFHEGRGTTIDHILVSKAFHPASQHAIGEVLEVTCLNQHLHQERPEASDHGQVVARIRLYGMREVS